MDIIDKVIKKNRVGHDELRRIQRKISVFMSRLNRELKKNNIKADAMLGGSAAKGTIVKGDFDCDIFVRFDYSYMDKDISALLKKALSRFSGVQRVHGSRDYFQLEHKSLDYEIVPVLHITRAKDAQNVTDMSPMHVEWILSRLKKNPRIRDEIIAAKMFCKANGIYGAESYIGGFSGHVLDILVAYYGSLLKLIENAVSWNRYKVIDIEGYNTFDELNRSKISPLIVIDPVDKNRNAAAALTMEKFRLFKQKAGEFLAQPSMAFFVKKQVSIKELKQKAGNSRLIILKAKPMKGKDDIVGCKLRKAHEYIQKQLELNGFTLIDSGWQWQKGKLAMFWYLLPDKPLDEEKIHTGPPLKATHDAARFKEKYSDCYVKDNRLYVKTKRRFIQPLELVQHLVAQDYISERTETILVIK